MLFLFSHCCTRDVTQGTAHAFHCEPCIHYFSLYKRNVLGETVFGKLAINKMYKTLGNKKQKNVKRHYRIIIHEQNEDI